VSRQSLGDGLCIHIRIPSIAPAQQSNPADDTSPKPAAIALISAPNKPTILSIESTNSSRYKVNFSINKKSSDYNYLQIGVLGVNDRDKKSDITPSVIINGNTNSVSNYNKINFNNTTYFDISNLSKKGTFFIVLNTINNYNRDLYSNLTDEKNINFTAPIGGNYRKKNKTKKYYLSKSIYRTRKNKY